MKCEGVKRMTGFAKRATKLSAIVLMGLPAACMGNNASAPDPAYAPVLAQPAPPPASANGSIFQVSNGYAPLTSGQRASMVGDILTIALVERTQASKSNGATADRNGSFGLTPPSTGPLSLFDPSDIGAGGNTTFSGTGTAAQSNALQGEITVTIAEVYPNGTMLVRGEKLMRLNRGDEHIRFSGIVRSADISPDNIVLSSRVANARIGYGGSGEIAQASKQGWLQRFFNIISPF